MPCLFLLEECQPLFVLPLFEFISVLNKKLLGLLRILVDLPFIPCTAFMEPFGIVLGLPLEYLFLCFFDKVALATVGFNQINWVDEKLKHVRSETENNECCTRFTMLHAKHV